MDITSDERTKSLRFLNSLAKSTSEQQYNKTYEKFANAVPEAVLQYFNKNWHPIKHEWTKFSMTCGNLGNLTNNRLESINSKIKQMVKKHSTMVAFVHSFFKWLNNREHEMLNKISKNFLKQQGTSYGSDSAEHQYMQQLTGFAFNIVEKELSQHTKITIRKSDENLQTCEILANDVTLTTTPLTCRCASWNSTFLPCKHIFATRKKFHLPLFTEELCPERWKKSYMMETNPTLTQETDLQEGTDRNPKNVSVTQCQSQKKFSETQKRKLLKMVTNDIVQMGMLSTEDNFPYRLEVLNQICNSWRKGSEVSVTKVKTRKEDGTCHDNNANNLVSDTQNVPMRETRELEGDMTALSIDDGPNSSSTMADNLDKLILPVPLKRKYRSKHADTTVIKYSKKKSRPLKFPEQKPVVQAKMILQWVISDEGTVNNILTGEYLMREADIPSDDQITDSIMADEVDLGVLSQYVEKRALQKLAKVVQKKKDKDDWRCRTCRNSLSESSIFCDACLSWYDYSCVNLKRAPKAKQWFCPGCKL